ncbi:MAG: amidohydrolase [Acidobacteria bacterium]|nr:MAG: amidohydrolase [Acidobacteriota bacterium]
MEAISSSLRQRCRVPTLAEKRPFLYYSLRHKTMPVTRRSFLGTLGAFAALPLLPPTRIEPEMVLYNANIWTVDDQLPRARAIAINAGRIFAVGSNDDVLPLASGLTRKVDLGGKTVLPGFNDAHAHPVYSGVDHLKKVTCDKDSIEAIQAALRERAGKTPPGEWVVGFLYDDGKTPRPINRHDLDVAVADHPVLIRHRGGHTIFVNSAALKLAGVGEKTADPAGGRYGRDSSGVLTGFVADSATNGFSKLISEKATRDDLRRGAAFISKMFTRKGVTSACDADAGPDAVEGYQDARDAGDLRFRTYCLIHAADLPHFMQAGIHSGFGDDWLRIGGVKQYADGSISERTAWLSQPYIGIPNYTGLQVTRREELLETSRKAHAAGWQLATHANGDLAIDEVLGIYEQVQKETPRRDPRFRIEHCTLVNPSLIQRMSRLKVIPAPFSCYVYFHGDVMHFYGEERTRNMFAMRSFIDVGLRPTDASDYTASPSDPMMWLESQLTRTDPKGNVWGINQRITLEEAIRCGTLNGAYASFEDEIKGSITAGKLADLVVLAQDPFKTAPSDLMTVTVERTMVDGKWVYES